MYCYCELKTDHDCPEMLDSFEKQYENNPVKFILDRSKIRSDPRQMIFAAHINEVKGYRIYPELDEKKIAKFNAVVSHFPNEFTKREKKLVYKLVLKMIRESKFFFLKNGRITFKGDEEDAKNLQDYFLH